MRRKPSLADAVRPQDRTGAAPARARATPKKAKRQPGREGKKSVIAYFDPEAVLMLKRIGIDRGGLTQQTLLAEALNDFFVKHRKPTLA